MVFVLGLLGLHFEALAVRRIRKSPNSRIYSGGPNAPSLGTPLSLSSAVGKRVAATT